MRWREQAGPVIAQVLSDCAGKTESEIRAALYSAYPFGQRQHYPYRIWLDEIRRQRGTKPALGTRGVKRLSGVPGEDDPNQGTLFS